VRFKKAALVAATICTAVISTVAASQSNSFDGVYKPRGAEFSHWDCKSIGRDNGAFSIKSSPAKKLMAKIARFLTL